MTLCNSGLSDKVSSEGTIEVPKFEALEPRLLLSGSAPVFATPLEDNYVITDRTLTIGIDGYDSDSGDVITFNAVSDNPDLRVYIPTGRSAILHFTDSSGTPIGDIVVVLFEDLSKAATDRFIALAQHNYDENGNVIEGADPYYTDVIVHRVIPGFMIQTGDAENGDGTGGSTLGDFNDYFSPWLNFSGSGVLAMANSGANTNDSQFFITADATTSLNQEYMIFGQMISGQDTYDTIINSTTDDNDRPIDPPVLSSVDIVPSDQDAAVIFQAADNFAGDVNVTITMTDSQGNVTSKGIVVSVDRDVNLWHVTPGVEQTFTVDLTKLSDPKIKCSDDNVAVNLDIDAGTVTIKTPEAYIGFFKLTLSDGDTTSREIFVASQELSNPQVLNQTSTGTENIYCTLRAGNLLYVGRASGDTGYGSIGIYDISDTDYIVSVAEITDVFNTVVDLQLNGDTLVVLDYNSNDVTGRISTVDVSDPYNPVTLAYHTSTFVPWGMEISGDYAFVADRSGELTAYDVSDPENIQEVGSFNTLPNDKHLNDAYDVAIKGNYAYVSGNIANAVASGAKIGQVFVVDISDPKNMQYIKSIIGGAPVGLDIEGNNLYVADQYSSLRVYDITNPASPLRAGALGLPGIPIYVDVEGNSAVVTCGSMFTLVDVTNPSALTISYVFNNAYEDSQGYSTQCTKPVMLNGVAVVPAFSGGLTLIDASDADNTRWFTGSLKYLDDGATVTITVTGGTARIVTAGHLSGKIESMDVYGDAKTTVSITTKKGKTFDR